jgi:hypothetical protein
MGSIALEASSDGVKLRNRGVDGHLIPAKLLEEHLLKSLIFGIDVLNNLARLDMKVLQVGDGNQMRSRRVSCLC